MDILSIGTALRWVWLAFLIVLSLYGFWRLRIRENIREFKDKETGRLAEEKGISINKDGRLRAVSRPIQRLEREETENENGSNDNSVIIEYIGKLEARLTLIKAFNKELDKRLLGGWVSFTLLTLGAAYLLLTSTEYLFATDRSLVESLGTANSVFRAYINEPLAVFNGQLSVQDTVFEGGKASAWAHRYVSFVIPSQFSIVWFATNYFMKPEAFEENISALQTNIKSGRKNPAAFRRKILKGSFGDRALAAIAFLVQKLFGAKERCDDQLANSAVVRDLNY